MDTAQSILSRYCLKFEELPNPNILDQISQGSHYGTLTGRGCDCDSVLVPNLRSDKPDPDLKKRRNILKAKGFNDEEINISLYNREKLNKAKKEHRELKKNKEYEVWVQAIRELVESGKIFRVGLLLHDFRGGFASENFTITKQEVSINELSIDFLRLLEPDIFYRFY